MGGAIAIDLATKHPDMAGLIVEGTFTSMKDMADSIPFLPIFPLDWVITQRFDSITKIKVVETPVLILHGRSDQTIPVSMANRLYAAAPQPKQLAIIDQANHDNLPKFGGQQYRFRLKQFINSVIKSTK